MRKFMQVFFKLVSALIIIIIFICGISFFTDNNRFGEWAVSSNSGIKDEPAWIKFFWTNEDLGKRHFDKTAMFIPAKVEGLPAAFSFQFDLGSDVTMIYENTARSVINKYPQAEGKIKHLKSPIQFWNTQKAFKNITIHFGGMKATSKNCFLKVNYGKELSLDTLTGNLPINIGTIGADMFKNKVLIIDYPNERFTICDDVPPSYKTSFTDMELDKAGRVIIPLLLNGKKHRVLFDNGSSIFPLLVTDDKIQNFSSALNTDTITISSWGTVHNIIGRPLKEKLLFAGQTFAGITVYTDYRKEARTNDFDAITGNALFWDKTIIIDFKNKKFGVK